MEKSVAHSEGETKKALNPNNVVIVPTTLDTDFFRWWCVFLRPFIKLTDREIDVVSSFLRQRHELSKYISNPAILDEMVMSENVKAKVQEECKISPQHLYVVMTSLRKNKIIVNNIINPRLIPNIRQTDNGCFQLLVLFKDNSERK